MTDEFLNLIRDRITAGLQENDIQTHITGVERTALLKLNDGQEYHFILKDNDVTVHQGGIENPNMTIESDGETLRKLLRREISTTSALLRKRLRVFGSATDLMKIRQLF